MERWEGWSFARVYLLFAAVAFVVVGLRTARALSGAARFGDLGRGRVRLRPAGTRQP